MKTGAYFPIEKVIILQSESVTAEQILGETLLNKKTFYCTLQELIIPAFSG